MKRQIDTTVQFFVPHDSGAEGELPRSLAEYWEWISTRSGVGEIGKYTWTLKTYLYLKEAGARVRLVTRFPASGIVVSHRDFLPLFLRPRPDVFLVCIKPDRKEHTWAHYYVVQNRSDNVFRGARAGIAKDILHWPQPALVPRSVERGDRCENVAYFGRTVNLADELESPAWTETLRSLAFNWAVVGAAKWNDYGEVDVTVSVRGFGEKSLNEDPLLDPNSKPPSKLINSWLAGVPAIVGRESAFQNIRESPLDYIEVATQAELTAALIELRRNRELYRAMVAHGRKRAQAFSVEAVRGQWQELVRTEIVPAYERWMQLGRLRRQYRNLGSAVGFLTAPRNLAAVRIYRDKKP